MAGEELTAKRPFRFSVSGGAPQTARALAERARKAESLGYSTYVLSDHLLDSPHVFIGTVDQLVAKFTRLRDELGISNIMVGSVIGNFAPVVERLAGT